MNRSNEFKNQFKVFSNSEMNVTSRWSRKSIWKKWGHFCSFHVPFLSYDADIVGKGAFFQFCADSVKYFKAIYIYASETSCYAFSENFIVYYAMTLCFKDISVSN